MSKKLMFSVQDARVETFGPPYLVNHEAEAIRGFTELVNDPNTTCGKYPEDFALYQIGVFDTERAHVDNLSPLRLVKTGAEIIKARKTNL